MEFLFKKTHNNAISPSKAHPTDSGYDLCLIEKINENNHNITMYETGIVVIPPEGYYFELVPRSSIIKYGYILANNIGIIDSDYRGSIKVPLLRINPNAQPLTLPSRIVQLIPRKRIDLNPIEINDTPQTQRGEGGFGSSGSANTTL